METAQPKDGSPLRRLGLPVGPALGMVVLTFLASVLNYASMLIFSRVLPPQAFGDLTALLALTVIATVPSGAAQTVVADRLAAHQAEGRTDRSVFLIRHAVAHVFLYSAVLGSLYLAMIPFVSSALQLSSTGSAIALAPMLALSFFTPVAFGVLQGLERFIALGIVMLVIAISRIAIGVPWALSSIGGGPGGALLGMAVGNVFALLVAAWIVRDMHLPMGSGAARSGIKRRLNSRTFAAGAAFTAFAVLSNFDVVLAKLVLDAHDSGQYAALATIEKIIIFLPGAVALVMVPSAAKERMTLGSARRVLRVSAAIVLVVTLISTIPAFVAPEFLVTSMFGDEYAAAASGVLPIVAAGAGLALMYLLVVYTVAIRNHSWTGLLVLGVALQVIAIGVFAGSSTEVAYAQAAAVWIVLLVNELLFHPLLRSGSGSPNTAVP